MIRGPAGGSTKGGEDFASGTLRFGEGSVYHHCKSVSFVIGFWDGGVVVYYGLSCAFGSWVISPWNFGRGVP